MDIQTAASPVGADTDPRRAPSTTERVRTTPLAGLFFRGATACERDDPPRDAASAGRPVFGPGALLADLELRLGLPGSHTAHGIRLQQWSQHLATVAKRGHRFYSASYAVDPIGTATTLLGWRDGLIEAGWDGKPIADGGARLETFAELEAEAELEPTLPLGLADRLKAAEEELARTQVVPWHALELAEPAAAWPGRWQRIFQLLGRRRVRVQTRVAQFETVTKDSDLGRLQASIRGETLESGFQGDGSFVLVCAETSWELAHAVASALRHFDGGSSLLLRSGDSLALGTALQTQGLASQGVDSDSAWRPALQLLSLAVELCYAPKDPYRVLELVTLPFGPFAGWVGIQLARALSAAPGIGGPQWQGAKKRIAEWLDQRDRELPSSPGEAVSADPLIPGSTYRLNQIAEWLEAPGHSARDGAPRAVLLEATRRVSTWLQRRLARAEVAAETDAAAALHDVAVLRAAYGQAQGLHDALSHDPRELLDLVAARQLMEEVSQGSVSLPLAVEEIDRMDVVDSPSGVRCSRDLVVWWHCVSGTQSAPALNPWRQRERTALAAAGVRLQDPAAVLAAEVEGWRSVVLSARRRLVLVVPSTVQGEHTEPHPILDELLARLDAKPPDIERITLRVDELLSGHSHIALRLPPLPLQALPLAPLPEPRLIWKLSAAVLDSSARYSASSLEDLVSCPLRWVLCSRAGLGSRWAVAIPSQLQLNGQLGHRLVEELHSAGVLADPQATAAATPALLSRLVEQEAAVLLRPGMTFELSQLRQQLTTSVIRLAELIQSSRLSVVGVEVPSSVSWGGRTLVGRLDLLLMDAEGREVVLDLKWGRASYRDKLEQGLALQLAVYAGSRQIQSGAQALPVAGYFALGPGVVLTTSTTTFANTRPSKGPPLADTWRKLDSTVTVLESMLRDGSVPVTGLKKPQDLLLSAGVAKASQDGYLKGEAPCRYCDHGSVCGRAWEHLS